MVNPYQTDQLKPLFVADLSRRDELAGEAENLPSVLLDSAAGSNVVMLGAGYFNPIKGFMNKADALSIADSMHTKGNLFWPIPILNRINNIGAGIEPGSRIALRDSQIEGNPVLAIQNVGSIDQLSASETEHIAKKVFGTASTEHPGSLEVLNFSYFETDFSDTFRTAYSIRSEIEQLGWKKAVAFQTRNPMHRAHEELCKIALERTNSDGVVIHMLLGKLKPGDIPAQVRDAAIRKMVELYFPKDTVLITGYGFDMLYAGPREAVLHAIMRQNLGASYMIVGRDHAGVGDFYGAFDSQTIFRDQVPAGTLEIEIFEADHTAYSKKLNKVLMMRDAPDHKKEDFVLLSGTRVREMLSAGQALPPEFSRPEVAQILMDHYRKGA